MQSYDLSLPGGEAMEPESILKDLDSLVSQLCSLLGTPGLASQVTLGTWGPTEIVSHFLFWHQVSIEGMESVSKGGTPIKLTAPVDELNAQTVARDSSKSSTQLTAEFSQLQERLRKATMSLPSLEVVVMERRDRASRTGREQLEMVGRHLQGHLEELQASSANGS